MFPFIPHLVSPNVNIWEQLKHGFDSQKRYHSSQLIVIISPSGAGVDSWLIDSNIIKYLNSSS